MLRPESAKYGPLFALGDWITSIPPRIGSNPVVTMAAEFLIHSFESHDEGSHSKKIQALQAKNKALKELQLSLLASQQAPTYDLLLATKMHYASEVLLGVTNLHYAIHTLGLMDLLRSGVVPGADEENFWNILDNTYVDDVTMAMSAGRPSIYDNDVYLSSTHPEVLVNLDLNDRQRISRAMMHVTIQCPRLTVVLRHAIRNPNDVNAIASAVSLAEKLWHLTGQRYFVDYINASIKIIAGFNDDSVADILEYGIDFDFPQNMVIATRYWLLQVFLCGTLDTLYRRFPVEFGLSLLPAPVVFQGIDVSAAMQLARVVLALGSNPSPLTLVRTHGAFSGSIGAWHRRVRYLSKQYSAPGVPIAHHMHGGRDLRVALRMKKWVLSNCNDVLNELHITQVDEDAWMEALDCMAGEELPDWLPSKVSFSAEDDEIVMKLEYSSLAGNSDAEVDSGPPYVVNVRNPAQFGPQHLREWVQSASSAVVSKRAPQKSCVVETANLHWLCLSSK
ncbi:hypothetical protein N0V86_002821 [Didymella sp. IMI 355093]|nr:hypothetical protein N0V86_002821 [Didymella sp. IMI 355093]